MSRKNKAKNKKNEQAGASQAVTKKDTAFHQGLTKKPMLNWLLLLVAILPFLFHWQLMDPGIAVRFTCLSGFIFLFILYFFGFRKKLLNSAWPFMVKLVFILGIAYGLWNMIGFFTAINKQQVYYGLSRHLLNMLLLFIITQVAEQEEFYLLQLCKLLAVTAIVHSFIGFCQFYELGFNDLPGNYKPYGLMANRNLFGSAQVLLLPFAIYVLYKGSSFWKYISGAAITGIIISAILSQTRSSWIAGLAIVIISLVLVTIFSPVNRKKWIIGSAIGLALITGLTFLLTAADTEGNLSASLKERTGSVVSTDTTGGNTAADNINERLKIWRKTIELIKDHPLTGVGTGNWKVALPQYGSEGLVWAKGKYVPDRPHNDYLLVAGETGISGALLYMSMWLVIAILAFKTIVKPLTEERRILNILMLTGLVAFAVDSMFSFPNERIEHSLYVYIMAGIIAGTYTNAINRPVAKQQLKKWLLVIFLITAGFSFFLGLKKIQFEKQLVLSKAYYAKGLYQQSIEEGNKGRNAFVSIDPDGFPIETYIGLSYKELKKFPEALKEMNKAISYYPDNKSLLVNKGTIYTDMEQYDTAIYYYNKAVKLTPQYDIIYFNLAANYLQMGKYKECLDALSKTDISNDKELLGMKQEAEAGLAAQKQ